MTDQHQSPEEQAAEIARLRQQIATGNQRAVFDRIDDFKWHEADSAFEAMRHKGYVPEPGDDGTVGEIAMRKAVRSFARENAYMVDAGEQKPPRPLPQTPSGGNVGSGRRRYDAPVASPEALMKKYPALRQ
jgi:hypothetical protein